MVLNIIFDIEKSSEIECFCSYGVLAQNKLEFLKTQTVSNISKYHKPTLWQMAQTIFIFIFGTQFLSDF